MKRIFPLFILLSFAFAATAQHDTLPYYIGVPQFYMEHSLHGAISDTNHNGLFCRPRLVLCQDAYRGAGADRIYENGDMALGFYPDSTLHVIGIAIPFWYTDSPYHDFQTTLDFFYSLLNHTYSGSSSVNCDSIVFRLYQPIENRMSLLKSVTIDTTFDTANCRVYKPYAGINSSYYSRFEDYEWVMMEVFFDSEVDLTDSFYVSCKYVYGDTNYRDLTLVWTEMHTVLDSFIYPIQSFREIENVSNPEDPSWHYCEYPCYPLLWPLIRRDCDTCPTVQGIETIRVGANQAYFRWPAGDGHRDWQLSYGPVGTAPEDGTIIDLQQRITGGITFSPDTQYVVYVRGRCRFARFEYGPWSAPLHFCLNDNNGIDETEVVDVVLTPNPAANKVTVAAEGMESVELVAVDGATVLRRECRGECTIDLAGMANGTYMVRVTTEKGVAARKLVVQR